MNLKRMCENTQRKIDQIFILFGYANCFMPYFSPRF